MLFDNQLGGSRSSIVRTWTWELGSGKVAGKVLIVDHMLCSAKLLILVDSVTC